MACQSTHDSSYIWLRHDLSWNNQAKGKITYFISRGKVTLECFNRDDRLQRWGNILVLDATESKNSWARLHHHPWLPVMHDIKLVCCQIQFEWGILLLAAKSLHADIQTLRYESNLWWGDHLSVSKGHVFGHLTGDKNMNFKAPWWKPEAIFCLSGLSHPLRTYASSWHICQNNFVQNSIK